MHPFYKILALVALLGVGTIVAGICMFLLALIQGVDVSAFAKVMMDGEGEFPKSLLRGMLWVQALAGFVLPAALFGWIFYRRQLFRYFDLSKAPAWISVVFAIVALFAAYPLVQLSYEVNSALPLPGWMGELEDNAAEILKDILHMETVGSFLITLILVAVLPGIGEELVFRGILQKQLEAWTTRPVLSVWIAAIIFSGIHMQFEGFLPRVALGAVLGFVYLWSRNLWIPIIVHAVNNGLQVSVLYFTGVDLSAVEQEPGMPLNVFVIILSVAVLFICYEMLTKQKRTDG